MPNDHYERILSEIAKLHATCERMHADYKRIELLLTGNGEPSKGLIVQVDRLTQESSKRDAWVKAAIGGVVASIIGFIGLLLKVVK